MNTDIHFYSEEHEGNHQNTTQTHQVWEVYQIKQMMYSVTLKKTQFIPDGTTGFPY